MSVLAILGPVAHTPKQYYVGSSSANYCERQGVPHTNIPVYWASMSKNVCIVRLTHAQFRSLRFVSSRMFKLNKSHIILAGDLLSRASVPTKLSSTLGKSTATHIVGANLQQKTLSGHCCVRLMAGRLGGPRGIQGTKQYAWEQHGNAYRRR